MEEIRIGQIPLVDIMIDERFWGPGSTEVIRRWLLEDYNPDTMPVLSTATVEGREGIWLLGWKNEGTPYRALLTTIFGEDYARARLDQVKALEQDQRRVVTSITPKGTLCPRCKLNRYSPYEPGVTRHPDDPAPPALSRTDNRTHICSSCGTDEAMRDLAGEPLPGQDEWPLIPSGSFGQGRL